MDLSERIGVGFNADLPVPEIIREAKLAENLGFDSLFMHEHSFGRDAFSFLNSLAGSTSAIRLGVACLTPYTRHPVVLATSMLTLQESSRGARFWG